MSITYAAKSIIEWCPWPGSVTDACCVRDIGHVTQFSPAASE